MTSKLEMLGILRARSFRAGVWDNFISYVVIPVIIITASGVCIAAETTSSVSAVVNVGMTVSDLDRSVDFYSKVLGFEKISDTEIASPEFDRLEGVFGARARVARLKLGGETIELTEYLVPRGQPIPTTSRSNDRWFQHIAIIVSDMGKAYKVLRDNKVQHASTGPQRLPDWNKNAGGIEAFYFKDPDNHTLEILHFPDGKGDPKWHSKTDRLFLGIDHTAVVVANTDASIAFYRDLLGMRVAGGAENWGIEQEHLNHVFGAHLRITSLRAAEGPAVELLEYITPQDGLPYPRDAHANDLLHWQTSVGTADLTGLAARLREARTPFVSPGITDVPRDDATTLSGLLARDPDGHAFLFEQSRN